MPDENVVDEEIVYTVDGENVKRERYSYGALVETAYLAITYTSYLRLDANNVRDVTYQFNVETGCYEEVSIDQRVEPLPPSEIDQLRAENAELRSDLDDLILMMAALITAGTAG